MSLCVSRLIATSSETRLPCLYSTNFTCKTTSNAPFVKNKNLASCDVHGFSERSLRYDPMLRIARGSFVVSSNMTPPPEVPPPSGSPSPSGSAKNWFVGVVLTFVLPVITHKGGPLLLLKTKVDTMVNTAEYLMETIEEVAEKVDHVIDSITDDLPEDSELRKKLESIDGLIEGMAKNAHMANNIIDKVEDQLESLIMDEAKVVEKKMT